MGTAEGEPSLKTSAPSGFAVIDAANPANKYRVHQKQMRTKVRLLHHSTHRSSLLSLYCAVMLSEDVRKIATC
jgi:hypothetical protein